MPTFISPWVQWIRGHLRLTHPKMIKRVEQNVYRICKECTPFLLLVFYHEIEAKMRLKVMAHPQAGQESLEQRYYYYKDFQFQEMPDLIRYNFTNLW